MHPVEALKVRVLELKETIPSREAIQRALVTEGHPEGLVEAAIEVAFADVREAKEAAAQKKDEQDRRRLISEVLGVALLSQVEDAGVGVARGAAHAESGFLSLAFSALIGVAVGGAVAMLPQPWALPVGVLLIGAGIFAGAKAGQAWGERGVILVVCTEGLVEVSGQGGVSTHGWHQVAIEDRARKTYEDDQGRHRKTVHEAAVRLADGRRIQFKGQGRAVAVFSAALASQFAANARKPRRKVV